MTENTESRPSRADSAAHPAVPFIYPGFDARALLAGQQLALEAWVAATQKLVEGLQELAKRQILLQVAFLERAFAGAASFAQATAANGGADEITRSAQAAMQTTIEALRNSIDTSCRCSMDALTAFRERMAGGAADAPACEGKEVAPTTAEVIAAQARSGEARGRMEFGERKEARSWKRSSTS